MSVKPGILFVTSPDWTSSVYNSSIKEKFQVDHYDLCSGNAEGFLEYLQKTFDSRSKPLSVIYGGFPAFLPIGGLTRQLLEDKRFPREDLKCVVLCSRGMNGIDLDATKQYGIQVHNYSDEEDLSSELEEAPQPGVVSDDVANCAMWHVLEGFRKFSFHQACLRKTGNTLRSRKLAAGIDPNTSSFTFGHKLKSGKIKSPRGQKALILGLGGIGKQIANKLHFGLGMEVHYAKRSRDDSVSWAFHKLDSSIYSQLSQFTAIVIALPGSQETRHLIDEEFLSFCSKDLILVNIGRGFIIESEAISNAIAHHRIRHLGVDVFYHEPEVETWLLENNEDTTITPHIGSGTEDNFYQSCEYALRKALKSCYP
ncbi:LAFA_0D11738g1_1 [Lachancea sp. 'fantastica']|nr:LAFA_0D11738g1_1 [Lachancea sp. 'fantastica']